MNVCGFLGIDFFDISDFSDFWIWRNIVQEMRFRSSCLNLIVTFVGSQNYLWMFKSLGDLLELDLIKG